jgi:hypothetical protein
MVFRGFPETLQADAEPTHGPAAWQDGVSEAHGGRTGVTPLIPVTGARWRRLPCREVLRALTLLAGTRTRVAPHAVETALADEPGIAGSGNSF